MSERDAGSGDVVSGHTHTQCLAQRDHLRERERGEGTVLLIEITSKTGIVNLGGRVIV